MLRTNRTWTLPNGSAGKTPASRGSLRMPHSLLEGSQLLHAAYTWLPVLAEVVHQSCLQYEEQTGCPLPFFQTRLRDRILLLRHSAKHRHRERQLERP